MCVANAHGSACRQQSSLTCMPARTPCRCTCICAACQPHCPGRVAPSPQYNRLNYFLIDRGPNSAMGAKVEGFRGECLCCKSHDQLPGEGCFRGELCRGACAAHRVNSCLTRDGIAPAAAFLRSWCELRSVARSWRQLHTFLYATNPPCLQMPMASSCTCGTLWGSRHLKWPWPPATWWVQQWGEGARPAVGGWVGGLNWSIGSRTPWPSVRTVEWTARGRWLAVPPV